eukprot:jgi/Tetstr1/448960/TSEL_036185.t1
MLRLLSALPGRLPGEGDLRSCGSIGEEFRRIALPGRLCGEGDRRSCGSIGEGLRRIALLGRLPACGVHCLLGEPPSSCLGGRVRPVAVFGRRNGNMPADGGGTLADAGRGGRLRSGASSPSVLELRDGDLGTLTHSFPTGF